VRTTLVPSVGYEHTPMRGASASSPCLARRMRVGQSLLYALALSVFGSPGMCGSGPADASFPSGELQLRGWLWKPDGPGPFPAILWNHGSERYPGKQQTLADFYTTHGYVFFTPMRRGYGRSPGHYIQDAIASATSSQRAERFVQLLELENDDVVAALRFLRSQSYVSPARVAISGCSYGGIQTLLAGERRLGVSALIPFAPGAMSWASNPQLRIRLRLAVDRAQAPIFQLQAANDYSIAPTDELSAEAEEHHVDFRAKIYPPLGASAQEGHAKFCTQATDAWGSDVLTFLEARMDRPG
jgi:carboxymethylenebutenolidase